jgi:hypothetical protein
VDAAIRADPAARADDTVRSNLRVFANVSVFADHSVRTDAGTRRDFGQRGDHRCRVNAICDNRRLAQQLRRFGERDFRVIGTQQRLTRHGNIFRHNYATRRGGGGTIPVLGGVHKDQIAGRGALRRGDSQ